MHSLVQRKDINFVNSINY